MPKEKSPFTYSGSNPALKYMYSTGSKARSKKKVHRYVIHIEKNDFHTTLARSRKVKAYALAKGLRKFGYKTHVTQKVRK